MGKLIFAGDGPTLGIYSSTDMYNKLNYESSKLKQGWHPYDAFNFLVTAWHLFEDWKKSDKSDALCRMKRQRRRLPVQMNFFLDIVRDIVNGSKHFQLEPNAAKKRRVGEVHTGEEVGFYELLFHENLPAVTVDHYWYFSIRVLHNIVMRYFEWVFDDTTSKDVFPNDVLETILHCNIANRSGAPSPPLWLLGIESAFSKDASEKTSG